MRHGSRTAKRGAVRRTIGSSTGPRPASQPAHSSASTALPGTNHVQSTKECTPKTTQTDSSVAIPTRSGVHGARRAAPHSPTVRPAAASQAASSASDTAIPTAPRSASVWTT